MRHSARAGLNNWNVRSICTRLCRIAQTNAVTLQVFGAEVVVTYAWLPSRDLPVSLGASMVAVDAARELPR